MIHQYKLGNLCVVLDVCSGSVRGVYAVGCDLFRKRMECAIAVAVARELGTE